MSRVKRGVTSKARHNKLFASTKGYRQKHRNTVKMAKNAATKAGQHAYVDRKTKKRAYHRLWVVRLNAACRAEGMMYSRLIYGLELANIKLDRKMLAELAVSHPAIFKELMAKAKSAIPAI